MKKKDFKKRCLKKNPTIVHRKIEDAEILIAINQDIADLGSIYSLNEVGGFVWNLIDGKRKMEDIVKEVRKEFVAGEKADLEKDIRLFIGQLEKIDGIKEVRA